MESSIGKAQRYKGAIARATAVEEDKARLRAEAEAAPLIWSRKGWKHGLRRLEENDNNRVEDGKTCWWVWDQSRVTRAPTGRNEASHSRQGLNATRGAGGTAACEQDASQGRFSCKRAARNDVAMKDKKTVKLK